MPMSRRLAAHPRAVLLAIPALLAASTMAPACAAGTLPVYRVTVLPDLGGGVDRPARINDQGFITGQSNVHPDDHHGVAYRLAGHRMAGLPQDTRGHPTYGEDINAAGTVVGYEWSGYRDGWHSWPFAWTADGTRVSFTQQGRFHAINDAGLATGESMVADGHFHAVAWQGGTMVDLGTLPGAAESAGLAINAMGDIAGLSGDAVDGSSPTRAMLRLDGALVDLGTLGGQSAAATGINASRQVCGRYSQADGSSPHGFVWEAATGAWQSLDEPAGTLWLEPEAINDRGVIVGRLRILGPGGASAVHAFAWSGGHTVDLNELLAPEDRATWVIEDAPSIDGHGRIVARAHRRGEYRDVGVLLRPVR